MRSRILLLLSIYGSVLFGNTTTTQISRLELLHPDLGYDGGAGLHTVLETMFTKIGDSMSSRYFTHSAIANSGTVTDEHNLGVALSELNVNIYTGTHPSLTRIADPVAAGWTIAATSGHTKTQIDVTVPSSGGPFTFAVVITPSAIQNVLTTTGDLVYASSGSVPSRLAFGAANTVLRTDSSSVPSWGQIVNADIGSSAAIAFSKLASLADGNILVGSSGAVPTSVAMSGDVTIVNSGATTIANNAITNVKVASAAAIAFSKLASLTSAHVLLGNGSNVATDTAISGVISLSNAGVTAFTSGAFGSNNISTTGTLTSGNPTITGFTDGSSAASGIVGEIIQQAQTTRYAPGTITLGADNLVKDSGGTINLAVTLTAGDWDITLSGGADLQINSGVAANNVTSLSVRLLNSGNTVIASRAICYTGGSNNTLPLLCAGATNLDTFVRISAGETYTVYLKAVTVSGTPASTVSLTFNEGNYTTLLKARRRR